MAVHAKVTGPLFKGAPLKMHEILRMEGRDGEFEGLREAIRRQLGGRRPLERLIGECEILIDLLSRADRALLNDGVGRWAAEALARAAEAVDGYVSCMVSGRPLDPRDLERVVEEVGRCLEEVRRRVERRGRG